MEISNQAKAFIKFCIKHDLQMDLDIDTMLNHITLTDEQRLELINIKKRSKC